MKPLPDEVKLLIRSYASDRVAATPTALIMKKLTMSYKEATDDNNIYLPPRLVVEAASGAYFLRPQTLAQSRPHNEQTFYLHDFLPSYWSDYANAFDSCEQ